MGRIAETGKLTPREAMFLRAYIKGATMEAAYLEIKPDSNPVYARNLGSRMLARIKAKVDWPRLMESAGQGEIRVLQENEKRLNQMKTIVVDKTPIVVEDGAVRMRATELIADLNGKRKLEISGPGGGPIPVQFIDDIPASTPK